MGFFALAFLILFLNNGKTLLSGSFYLKPFSLAPDARLFLIEASCPPQTRFRRACWFSSRDAWKNKKDSQKELKELV
jgi:hypothetical protein